MGWCLRLFLLCDVVGGVCLLCGVGGDVCLLCCVIFGCLGFGVEWHAAVMSVVAA